MSNTLTKALYDETVNDNYPACTSTNENATCTTLQVATHARPPVNVEPLPINELDLLDASDFLSPEVDRVLNDISAQQLNVNNQSNHQMLSHMLNISNVNGGVLNFYVTHRN